MPYIIGTIIVIVIAVGTSIGIKSQKGTQTPTPTPSPIEETTLNTLTAQAEEKVAPKTVATSTTPKPKTTTTTQTPVKDTKGPVISNVRVSNILANGADITWTTDESSDSTVEFGRLMTYGALASNPTLVKTHTIRLTGLVQATPYHFRVISKDVAGNKTTSKNYTFDTLAVAPQTAATTTTTSQNAPMVSAVAVQNITSTSARIVWTTHIISDSQVEYGKNTAYSSSTVVNIDKVLTHTVTLNDLIPDTEYHFRVKSKVDTGGAVGTSADTVFRTIGGGDTTAPTLSDITVSSITSTEASINWNTNEPADGIIEYGLTTSYGTVLSLGTELSTSHAKYISGLEPGKTYHFRVKSKDAADNIGQSSDRTFDTLPAPVDETAPVLSNISVSHTDTTITITWTTNEDSDTRVEYTPSGGSQQLSHNTTLTKDHQVVLTGLTPDTDYELKISSKDEAGNQSTPDTRTEKTDPAPESTGQPTP